MAAVRRTITFTDKLNDWVLSRTKAGGCAESREYIRNLIRKDRERYDDLSYIGHVN